MKIEMSNTRKKSKRTVKNHSTKEISEKLAKATQKLEARLKEIERKEGMLVRFPRKRQKI